MRNTCVLGLFFLVSFFGWQSADAATLYFDPSEAELFPGDTMTLSLRLDTEEGECINVVDGVITFSDNVTPVDVTLGNSILPLWIEQPTINKDERKVTFAGGIPNGYCGRISGDPRLTNVILELVLQAPGLQIGGGDQSPTAHIVLDPQTQVLLNDNAGTKASLSTIPANILVHPRPSGSIDNEWGDRVSLDKTPPSEFSIILSSDPSIFAGQYFVAFNTTDKQSGIDHYELMEEPIDQLAVFDWGRADAPWEKVKSPYKLKDQTLNSVIRVRAVDKAGNEYVAVYVPSEDMRLEKNNGTQWVLVGVTGFGVIVIIALAVLFYVRRTRKYADDENEEIPLDNDEDI